MAKKRKSKRKTKRVKSGLSDMYEVWNISTIPSHHARNESFETKREAYEWMAKYCSHVGDKYEIRETVDTR